MTQVPPWLRRNWAAALGFAAALILALLLAVRTDERDAARLATERAEARHRLFAERVRARAEKLRADFLEHARRTEQQQTRINQEVSRDYQDRIADLHRRYAELLRRDAAAGPGAGDPARPAPVPAPGFAPGRPDAAPADPRLSLLERLIATEQAIRLEALQEWVRRQARVGH